MSRSPHRSEDGYAALAAAEEEYLRSQAQARERTGAWRELVGRSSLPRKVDGPLVERMSESRWRAPMRGWDSWRPSSCRSRSPPRRETTHTTRDTTPRTHLPRRIDQDAPNIPNTRSTPPLRSHPGARQHDGGWQGFHQAHSTRATVSRSDQQRSGFELSVRTYTLDDGSMTGEYDGVDQDVWDRHFEMYHDPPPQVRRDTPPVQVRVKVEKDDGAPRILTFEDGHVDLQGSNETALPGDHRLDPSPTMCSPRFELRPLSQPLRLPIPPETPISPLGPTNTRPPMTAPSVPSNTARNRAGVTAASPAEASSNHVQHRLRRLLFVNDIDIPTTFNVLGDEAGTGLASYLIKRLGGVLVPRHRATIVIFPLRQGTLATLPEDLQMLEYIDSLGSAYAASEDWVRACDESDRVIPLEDFLVRSGEAAVRGSTTESPSLQPSKRFQEGIQPSMDKQGRDLVSSGAEHRVRFDNGLQHDGPDREREHVRHDTSPTTDEILEDDTAVADRAGRSTIRNTTAVGVHGIKHANSTSASASASKTDSAPRRDRLRLQPRPFPLPMPRSPLGWSNLADGGAPASGKSRTPSDDSDVGIPLKLRPTALVRPPGPARTQRNMPTPVQRALDAIQGSSSAKHAREDDEDDEEPAQELPVFRLPKKRRLMAKLAGKDTGKKTQKAGSSRTRPRVGQERAQRKVRDFGTLLPSFKRTLSGVAGVRERQLQKVREKEVMARHTAHVKPVTSPTRAIDGPLPKPPPAAAVSVPAGEPEHRNRSQPDALKLSWDIDSGDMTFLIVELRRWVASGMAGSRKQFLLNLREAFPKRSWRHLFTKHRQYLEEQVPLLKSIGGQ